MRPDNYLLRHILAPDYRPRLRDWIAALGIILVLAVDWVGLLFG